MSWHKNRPDFIAQNQPDFIAPNRPDFIAQKSRWGLFYGPDHDLQTRVKFTDQ